MSDRHSTSPGTARAEAAETAAAGNFVRDIILADTKSGRYEGRVATRFPPEPNGYLHIGHAKAICIDFGMAREFGGTCNLRFDDTNPTTEDVEYVEAIQEDIRWLGFDWTPDNLHYASDYFERLYEFAVRLIEKGPGLRRQPDRGRDPRVSAATTIRRGSRARTEAARWRRTSTSSAACGQASSPRGRTSCAPRSISSRRT